MSEPTILTFTFTPVRWWHWLWLHLYILLVALLAFLLMPVFAVLRAVVTGIRVGWAAVADPSDNVRVKT